MCAYSSAELTEVLPGLFRNVAQTEHGAVWVCLFVVVTLIQVFLLISFAFFDVSSANEIQKAIDRYIISLN